MQFHHVLVSHVYRLYDSCPWSTRAVGRLVVAKKLAPRYLGVEEEGGAECPICFLVSASAVTPLHEYKYSRGQHCVHSLYSFILVTMMFTL